MTPALLMCGTPGMGDQRCASRVGRRWRRRTSRAAVGLPSDAAWNRDVRRCAERGDGVQVIGGRGTSVRRSLRNSEKRGGGRWRIGDVRWGQDEIR